MSRYGLSPGTLKGELFTILSSQGNKGMKVSELAKTSRVSLYGVYFENRRLLLDC